jgi:hypothetical protein
MEEFNLFDGFVSPGNALGYTTVADIRALIVVVVVTAVISTRNGHRYGGRGRVVSL